MFGNLLLQKTTSATLLGATDVAREIPSQKWMNFYTKILTKLGVNSGLRLTVRVDCKVEGGRSIQKVEELKSALRELGLDDRIE